MDRRFFLKTLFAVGLATAIDIDKAIEQTLIDTINMTDNEFVTYVMFSIEMYIQNPAQFMIIHGIEENDK